MRSCRRSRNCPEAGFEENKLINSNLPKVGQMADTLSITVHAESEAGFDKSKLQNGVLEPLREADLIE